MEPLHFGIPPHTRYGVFYGPRAGAVPRPVDGGSRGVLLCYPLGHEYLRAHRAFRNLALALQRSGLPVLCFDYVGTGDSEGDGSAANLTQWQADIDAAADELKRRSGVSRVSLVGLRFGATLATLAAARRSDVDTLVLWDPVLTGQGYLDELEAVQQAWLQDRLGAGAEQLAQGQPELIGMPVHDGLLAELRSVDLHGPDVPRVDRLLIVISSPRDECVAWLGELKGKGVPAGLAYVPSAGDWLNPEAVHQLLLPHEILKQIAAFTAGA